MASGRILSKPQLLEKAVYLDGYLKTLTVSKLATIMKLSGLLANKTHALIHAWSFDPKQQFSAVNSFVGDIYSGLRASSFSKKDEDYANETLRILSGLYGIIRPYDGICPYRLEMGYKFPDSTFGDLYTYWGDSIAKCLPQGEWVVNLSSHEYSQAILPFITSSKVLTPQFLTKNPNSGHPVFVAVHAKIARGAFARWLITEQIEQGEMLKEFHELGYVFYPALSQPNAPVFVCDTFGGKGLSIRLKSSSKS